MAERSPNFPQIGLRDAVESVRLVYQREGRSKMPRLSAVKPLGYTSINGRSLGMLAALRAYGLLEGRGDDVKVSDDALTIINAPSESEERRAALVRAFEGPPAFALLRAKGEASPDTLRWHLIKSNFRDDAADKLIKVYLDSHSFLNAEGAPLSSRLNNDDTHASEPNFGHDSTRENRANPSGHQGVAPTHHAHPPGHQTHAYVGRTSDPSAGIAQPDFKISLGGGRWLLIEVRGGEPTDRDFVKLEKFARFQRELLEDDPGEIEQPYDEDRDPRD